MLTTAPTNQSNTPFASPTDVGNYLQHPFPVLYPESGVVTFSEASSAMKSEIVEFSDQNPSYSTVVESQPDPTFGVADMGDLSLATFLSRPVNIQSFEWATAQPQIYERFNPWRDFFNEPRIANRIAHYAFMRCKLRVKILVNGNAFHYGRAMLSYLPNPQNDYLSKDRAWVQQDLIQASQRPHVYLDPTYSQGGEMTLPFFYYKNMVSIPDSEYDNLGELILHTINVLKHANGATDKVTINIFAWAEDVVLTAPTSNTSAGLTPQSGVVSDEYGQGPVSKPASVVARVAKSLTMMPGIGPYARATEIGAGALAKIAGMMGYCRPTDITTIKSFKPVYIGNMANTNMEDTVQKLTVDVKQELTIDPRTTGLLDKDELTIESLAERESYLTSFDWDVADTQGLQLWATGVTPCLFDTYESLEGKEFHLTALAVAAAPFQHWRGEMEFRFQIVASQYHRGRLRITYEPYGRQSSTNYTENYSWVMDLAENKDMTVKVGWAKNIPYAKTLEYTATSAPPFGSGYTPPVTNDPELNGTLTVSVVNDLTVPNSVVDNDIRVNVFVKSHNIEFAAPWSSGIKAWTTNPVLPPPPEKRLKPESGEVPVEDTEGAAQPSAPETTVIDASMAAPVDTEDYTNHVFFGESIRSFRTLLKRYNKLVTSFPPIGVGNWRLQRTAVPAYRGPHDFTGQVHESGLVSNTLLAFLMPGYTGWRGNIRHKLMVSSPTDNVGTDLPQKSSVFTVKRQNRSTVSEGLIYRSVINEVDFTTGGEDSIRSNLTDCRLEGISAQPVSQNNVLEVEIPFYCPLRYLPTKQTPAIPDDTGIVAPAYDTNINIDTTQGGAMVWIEDYVATGEDFSLFFFTGMPPLYFNSSI